MERKQALRALKTFAKEIRHLVEAEEDGHRFFFDRDAVLFVLAGMEKFLAQDDASLDQMLGLARGRGVRKGEGRRGKVAAQIRDMQWAGKSKKQIAKELGYDRKEIRTIIDNHPDEITASDARHIVARLKPIKEIKED